MRERKFVTIEPKILYFGTPVALISSLNEDDSTNLAPMSSFWALGWTLMLGLLDETKTAENFGRHPECVINLPSPDMWPSVEKLAPLTGKDPVPDLKAKQFRFEKDKFEVSQALGERVLMPAVRGAAPETILVSDGFSCREQIRQNSPRHALHLAEVLAGRG